MKKVVLSNLMSNYLAKTLNFVLGVLMVPFLIHKLGKEVFGVIVLAESMTAFFEIATTSLKVSMTRYVTFSSSSGNRREFEGYLATGRGLLFAMAALVLAAGAGISYFFPHMIKISPEYARQSQILFLLIAISFSFSLPNVVFWSILFAKQRFDLLNLSMSGGVILKYLILFVVLQFLPASYHTMVSYGFIYMMTLWMQNFLIYLWHKKIMPDARIDLRLFDRRKVGEIFSYGFHASVGRLGQILYDNTTMLLIGFFWGPAFNAVYSVSLRLASVMKRLFVEAAWTITPTFIDLEAKNDRKRGAFLFFTYTKAMTILTTPLCLILIVMAGPIIELWVGPHFAVSAKLLPIHILPLFMSIPFSIGTCITNALAKVKIPSLVSLLMAVVNVILSVVLGVGFGLGLFGMAIAASVSISLYLAVFWPVYACRIYGVPVQRYMTEGFFKPFGLTLATMLSGFTLMRTSGIGFHMSWPTWTALAALVLLHYAISFLAILNPREKKNVHEIIKFLPAMLEKLRRRAGLAQR